VESERVVICTAKFCTYWRNCCVCTCCWACVFLYTLFAHYSTIQIQAKAEGFPLPSRYNMIESYVTRMHL